MQTIRAKMILALIVPAAVLVPVAVITMSATESTHRSSRAVRRSADILQGAQRLLLAAVDSETGVRGFVITGDDRFLEPWNNGRAALDAEAVALRRHVSGDPEQLGRLERMTAIEQQWRVDVGEPQIASIRANTDEAAVITRSGTGKALKDQVRTATAEFVAAERDRFDERISANERAVDRARTASIVGPALAGMILLVLALGLARNIAGRLANVAGAADRLAAGDLTRRVSDPGSDEIARLGRAFNEMATRLEESIQAESRRREALQAAVERCSAFSARVADGDLTARISPDGDGEVNRLYENLNGMVADLGAIASAVR